MVKILIGGSPCTFWSIAQHNGRETQAEGLGWELFKNYVIAKEKFQPDYFLYENNKSAAQAIKDQIQEELGQELMYINSALVSAQNRQRFYVFNWEVEQPADRKIYLRDILESAEYYQYQEEADRAGLTAVRVGQIDKGSQGGDTSRPALERNNENKENVYCRVYQRWPGGKYLIFHEANKRESVGSDRATHGNGGREILQGKR